MSLKVSAPIRRSVINWVDSAVLLFNLIISLMNPVINTLLPNPDQWKSCSLPMRDAQLTVREHKNENMER